MVPKRAYSEGMTHTTVLGHDSRLSRVPEGAIRWLVSHEHVTVPVSDVVADIRQRIPSDATVLEYARIVRVAALAHTGNRDLYARVMSGDLAEYDPTRDCAERDNGHDMVTGLSGRVCGACGWRPEPEYVIR